MTLSCSHNCFPMLIYTLLRLEPSICLQMRTQGSVIKQNHRNRIKEKTKQNKKEIKKNWKWPLAEHFVCEWRVPSIPLLGIAVHVSCQWLMAYVLVVFWPNFVGSIEEFYKWQSREYVLHFSSMYVCMCVRSDKLSTPFEGNIHTYIRF